MVWIFFPFNENIMLNLYLRATKPCSSKQHTLFLLHVGKYTCRLIFRFQQNRLVYYFKINNKTFYQNSYFTTFHFYVNVMSTFLGKKYQISPCVNMQILRIHFFSSYSFPIKNLSHTIPLGFFWNFNIFELKCSQELQLNSFIVFIYFIL